MDINPRTKVLLDVAAELDVQDEKWGRQDHLDGTGFDRHFFDDNEVYVFGYTALELADFFKRRCRNDNWRDILLEEVFEALAEEDPKELRKELIQVVAVASQWVEAIDRREDG